MPRFLADEDFSNDFLRGLQRRVAHVDIVRVRDVGLRERATRMSSRARRTRTVFH
jgi:hypothetical protein